MPKVRYRTVEGLKLKVLEAHAYEFLDPGSERDYHVRKEGYYWVVDVFDSTIKKHDDAWIQGDNFPTLKEAVLWIKPTA